MNTKEMNNLIKLKNKFIVEEIPKNSVQAFKNIKKGDILNIELTLTHRRGGDNNGLYAYYPCVNGINCSVFYINKLISNGMILEEIEVNK